ncbi:hypothetical protein JCM10207_006723 [Rhodosporidiobolus poonsookiae]
MPIVPLVPASSPALSFNSRPRSPRNLIGSLRRRQQDSSSSTSAPAEESSLSSSAQPSSSPSGPASSAPTSPASSSSATPTSSDAPTSTSEQPTSTLEPTSSATMSSPSSTPDPTSSTEGGGPTSSPSTTSEASESSSTRTSSSSSSPSSAGSSSPSSTSPSSSAGLATTLKLFLVIFRIALSDIQLTRPDEQFKLQQHEQQQYSANDIKQLRELDYDHDLCADKQRRDELYTQTSTSEFTLTTSGTVVVVTSVYTAVVTGNPSATGSRNLNDSSGSGNSFFNNTGAVAGTFVVVGLLAAGIVIGLGWFFLRRKRARQLDEDIRVAAGGAGDGGAGINRFDGEDDDDASDPFDRFGSEGHGSGYMSSYGTVPLTAAAAGFGAARRHSGYDYPAAGSGNGRPSYDFTGAAAAGRPSFEPGHSPAQSQGSVPPMSMAYAAGQNPPVVGYNGYGTGMSGARSHEGILHGDWAEYVGGVGAAAGAGAGTGEGSPHDLGSQEGNMGSGNSHSAHGHSPAMRDSVESYYPSDQEKQDVAAFRNSLYGGLADESAASTPPQQQQRTDDRLDPNALGTGEAGRSAASLGDENDYSRRILRVANPSG